MKFEKPDLSLESIALDLSMYHEVGHTSLAWNRPEYDSFLRKFIPVIPPREKTYIMEHIFLLQSIFRIALYLVVLPESDDGDSADDSIVVSDLESLGDIFSKNPSAMIFPIFPSEDLSEAFAGIP